MTRRLLRALIPRAWTDEEALRAANVLRAALDAVWDVHGERLAEALVDRPVDTWDHYFAEDTSSEEIEPDDSLF